MTWISLLLLGIILLLLVRQNTARVTRTPWWVLWLVLMFPAFFTAIWTLIRGNQSIPTLLLVSLFILSSFSYVILLRRGQIPGENASPPSPEAAALEMAKEDKESQTKLLNRDEEAQLQGCFPWGLYYLQQIEYRPQAVICRGQMRGTSEKVFKTIQDNIAHRFGDRFLVTFQMGLSNKPFFALIPRSRLPQAGELHRPNLSLSLFLMTLLTTTMAGLALAHPDLTATELSTDPRLALAGLPYAVALMAILGIHEMGHFLAARYYQIRATLPYFIPLPFALGTLGAFIQMRSPIPHRRALFDVGIAGPITGFLATIPILVWGLSHSELVPLANDAANNLDVTALNPRLSILFAVFCRLVFGSELTTLTAIHLHPVAIAGLLGLVVTALNLMPVGQLDGGHIVHAMYGHRAGAIIAQISRLLILILSFIQPWLFFWAIILFFMPAFDEPAVNDVSELNNWRDGLGLMALALLIVIIFPVPEPLSQILLTTHPMP